MEEVTHDYYTLEEDKKSPVIKRKNNVEDDRIFLGALAKMHNTDTSKIEIEYTQDGHWKLYKINGHQIFKDRA